jgi:hypothetical protein
MLKQWKGWIGIVAEDHQLHLHRGEQQPHHGSESNVIAFAAA